MSNVVRRAALVGSMTGISRLAGLVREQLMAYHFGTGLAKSAFDVAFRIPNLFRRLFGEGALSAAFIPVYTEVRAHEGDAAANRLVARVAGLLIAALSLITALGMLFTLWLQGRLDPVGRWSAILPLLRIMLPYAPLICLAALTMGILNTRRHFAIPALAPVALNLIWIVTLLTIAPFVSDDPMLRIRAVAWAVLVAGGVQVAVQLPLLRRCGIPLLPSFCWRGDRHVGQILRLMAPMALGAGLVQINVCLDGILALWSAEWAPSALEYAERLVYLPLGLVGNAFATVLLPTLSSHAAEAEHEAMGATLERALRNIVVLMAPLAIGLTLLALPTVTLIYRLGSGAFQEQSAIYTARALMGYAPGLLVFSLYKALTPAFYALQDTRTPVVVGLYCVGLNLTLNIASIILLPEGWKHVGIAASTVIASLVNCALLISILQRRRQVIRIGRVVPTLCRAVAVALMMGVVVVWLHPLLLRQLAAMLPLKLAQTGAMAAAVTLGGVSYLVLTLLLNRNAWSELVAEVRARPPRRSR